MATNGVSGLLRGAISALLLMLCACHSTIEEQGVQMQSIAHLKGLCRGASERIVEDVSIRGTVVATDWMGESYKSIVVADTSGGIEVAIDSHSIYEMIPVYSEVEIFCNGLALGRIGGKIRLGMPPTGDMPVDNIPSSMVGRYVKIVGEGVLRDYSPRRIDELSSDDICTPILIENIEVIEAEQGLGWCDCDEKGERITTIRTIVDGDGQSLEVRTLGSALYAGEKIPEGTFSLGGVADYADGHLFLRITNHCIILP